MRKFDTGQLWYDILGYEGLYMISDLGQIKSFKGKEKLLKQSKSWGYCRIRLYKDNIGKDFSVHRLVAENIIPNPEKKSIVNHIDGNKENNKTSNLEWVTTSENNKHAFVSGLNRNVLLIGRNTRFKKGYIPWNKGLKYANI